VAAARAREEERAHAAAEAVAAVERARDEERRRLSVEAAAAAERAREEERARLAVEAAAAAERARLEIEALEKEARLATKRARDAERAMEEERRRLQADVILVADRARENERARLEAEQRQREEAAAAEKRAAGERRRERRRRPAEPGVLDSPSPIASQPLVVPDQFAEFREEYDHVVPEVFRHMPVDAWTRTESWRKKDDAVTAQEQERDEFRELMAALTLSPQVAGVSYPRGCRIRRVRVTGPKPDPRGEQTLIVSRRALEEARSAAR
jgi:hypothetical protein